MTAIQTLETRRRNILQSLEAIRSMKRGTIAEQYLPAKRKGEQGPKRHGPYYVLARWEEGKTVSQRLRTPEALAQARQDVANHERFVALCKEYECATEELGALEREHSASEEALKKAHVALEQSQEVARIVAAVAREGRVDLEAVERAIRTAVLAAGAQVLEQLLEPVGLGRREAPVRCPRCGAVMDSRGVCSRQVVTLVGGLTFSRSRFVCAQCGAARFPGDEALGIVDTSRSPGVQRLEARLGAKEAFREVAVDLELAAGLSVSAKDAERVAEALGEQIERWSQHERREQRRPGAPEPEGPPIETLYVEFDGTGVPMVAAQLAGRKGKQPDGTAKTREAKLGCVFTQTGLDEAGRPLRDRNSASFVGAIETADAFGARMYDEAVRRGLYRARRVVTLSDGAEWAKSLADTQFPNALHIIDFYHAAEHIARLAKEFYERSPQVLEATIDRWTEELYEGRVQAIIDQASALLPKDPDAKKDARKEIAYLDKNKDRMKYGEYRAQGLFIGSGVIEAACKHVIGQRLKQSGMFWSLRGANAIIALRCAILSNRFEAFWEYRYARAA